MIIGRKNNLSWKSAKCNEKIVAADICDGDEQPDQGGPHRHGAATAQRPHHPQR